MDDEATRRAEIARLNDAGVEALFGGLLDEAARLFERAVESLHASDDDLARIVYENLGLAYHRKRLSGPALRAFLRALDGSLTSNQQSLRHAVTCLVNRNRFEDAGRLLDAYEGAFGPHPEGWTQAYLDNRVAEGQRRPPTYWSRW